MRVPLRKESAEESDDLREVLDEDRERRANKRAENIRFYGISIRGALIGSSVTFILGTLFKTYDLACFVFGVLLLVLGFIYGKMFQ